MDITEEELEELLPRNKYTFKVSVQNLSSLLKKIKPEKGNFLFIDIIGRLVWNAAAISNSINTLIENNDSYGVKSLIRKLF